MTVLLEVKVVLLEVRLQRFLLEETQIIFLGVLRGERDHADRMFFTFLPPIVVSYSKDRLATLVPEAQQADSVIHNEREK